MFPFNNNDFTKLYYGFHYVYTRERNLSFYLIHYSIVMTSKLYKNKSTGILIAFI
jgi:hypothetical protein